MRQQEEFSCCCFYLIGNFVPYKIKSPPGGAQNALQNGMNVVNL